MQRKSESGRSMVEIIGVLAIGALLTSGAVVLIQSGMESQKRSRTVDEVEALVSAARLATMGTGDYSSFPRPAVPSGRPEVIPAGDIKAKRLLKMQTNVTPFGGQSKYVVSGDENNLTIWVLNIDKDSCELMERSSFAGASYVKCHDLHYMSTGTQYSLTINYTE